MQKQEHQKKPRETRAVLWDQIRRLRVFTMKELRNMVSFDESSLRAYLKGLVAAGYLERSEVNSKKFASNGRLATRYSYTLVRDAIEAPRVKKDGTRAERGRGRAALWIVMHVLTVFAVRDLVASCSSKHHVIAEEEVITYVGYLTRAGYLKKIGKSRKSSYRLIKWTGPKAPMIQRNKQVYDPNERQIVWSVRPPEDGE